MEQYKKEITKLFEKMTKDDQVELHGRIVRGDVNARNKVIENCLPLAYRIADNYHVNNKHIDFEEDVTCRKFVFPNEKPTQGWEYYEVTCSN